MTKNEIQFKQLKIEEKRLPLILYIFHENVEIYAYFDINSLSNVPCSNIYESSREPVYQSSPPIIPHLLCIPPRDAISFIFH